MHIHVSASTTPLPPSKFVSNCRSMKMQSAPHWPALACGHIPSSIVELSLSPHATELNFMLPPTNWQLPNWRLFCRMCAASRRIKLFSLISAQRCGCDPSSFQVAAGLGLARHRRTANFGASCACARTRPRTKHSGSCAQSPVPIRHPCGETRPHRNSHQPQPSFGFFACRRCRASVL